LCRTRYPTFFRTNPSASEDAFALIALCTKYGWTRVTVLHTIDTYGDSLDQQFAALAAPAGVTVVHDLPILFTGTTAQIQAGLVDSMSVINPDHDKIFFVFATYAYTADVLIVANNMSLLSATHLWVSVQSSMTSSLLDTLAGPALSPITNLTTPAQLAARYERTRLANGLIGTTPALANSQLATDFLNAWYAASPSEYTSAGQPGVVIDNLSPFSYDAVFVYAHALAAVLASGQTPNVTNVLQAVQNTSFVGVTGLITFDVNQDRVGAAYTLANFRGNDSSSTTVLANVGHYENGNVTFSVEPYWTIAQLSTPPDDTIVCPASQLPDEDGNCQFCDPAAHYDTASNSCLPCGSGYQQSSDGSECVLDGGLVAAIVIIVVLCSVLVAAGAGIVVWRALKQRRAAEREAATVPAKTWDLETEQRVSVVMLLPAV
jgi:hypothetical protein